MLQMTQFQKEFESEVVITRKMLSIVPNDRYDWKPHEKSMSIRQLATHIAELPLWIGLALNTDELDFAVDEYKPRLINSTEELLACFEENVLDGRQQLANGKEETLQNEWLLRNGEQIYSRMTKAEMIRMAYSQTIHHRAQLGVFLRLLNIPIPGTYGPSADDMSF